MLMDSLSLEAIPLHLMERARVRKGEGEKTLTEAVKMKSYFSPLDKY